MQAQRRMIGYRHLMTESKAFFTHLFHISMSLLSFLFCYSHRQNRGSSATLLCLQAADQQKNQVGDSRVIVMMFMGTIDQREALAL